LTFDKQPRLTFDKQPRLTFDKQPRLPDRAHSALSKPPCE
jgi:hypothetical protein